MFEITSGFFLILSIMGLVNLFIPYDNSKMEKFAYTIVIISFVVIAGFRGETPDTSGYKSLFDRCPDFFTLFFSGDYSFLLNTREELGYLFVNVLVKIFTDSSEIFFMVIAGIALSFYYYSIRNYSIYPMLSLLLYYTNVFLLKEMAQIRQGVAMSIFIFSLKYIISNDFKKYLFCIVIASMFHTSILVALLIYPLRKIRMNYSAGLFFILVIMLFLSYDVIDNILFAYFIDGAFMKRITVYLNSFYLAENDFTRFYEYLTIFCFFILIGPFLRFKLKYYDLMMLVLGFGLTLMSIWHTYPFFGDRFAVPMWVSLIFLLPGICVLSHHTLYRVFSFSILIVIALKVFSSNISMLGY